MKVFYKLILATLMTLMSSVVQADSQQNPVMESMDEVVVQAQEERMPVLPDVQGAKIYSGKKTSVIDLQEQPTIVNNNYRQTFQKTPGLLVSEETTPLFSVGYRGLDPHRAQFTQVLKDGIPIHADMFGYPEAYYTPALQTIDRIEFLRGGASLMYGPQPGGALNFVTKEPYENAPLSMTLENSGGSHGLFSNYTSLSGTQNQLGYYGYFHHRQSQGFRAHNSQFDLFSGGTKFKVKTDDDSTWKVVLDSYEEEHGEPGGLTRAAFDADPTASTRLNDHFELNRYAGSLGWEKELDDNSLLEWKTFGGYYERLSWRQRTSGSSFGTVPNGTTNDIESQEFFTGGSEGRFRHDYQAFGADENNLMAGLLYYHVTSPRVDKRGTTRDAVDGDIRKEADRDMNYVSLFAENRFKFGKFSLTPGLRLENIWQDIKEKTNLDKTTVPLADDEQHDFVPLAGVGAAYELSENSEVYANVSQSYRPKIYTQAVPTGSGQVVNEDLEEGKAWQTDVGWRGYPLQFVSADASVFYMDFKDQIGTSGSTVENVGDARHYGVEFATEFDLLGWVDHVTQTNHQQTLGTLDLFTNVTLLNAKFDQGPNKGKTPQYAPDYILRSGLEYDYHDKAKMQLVGTFVDDHFANDTNTAAFIVPSYKVWDLTGEWKVYKDAVSLFAGINNIFDEQYYARIRSDGIDPADGRNYYGGMKIIW